MTVADVSDIMVEVQDDINTAELKLRDLHTVGVLDADQTERLFDLIQELEKLQIECMGVV